MKAPIVPAQFTAGNNQGAGKEDIHMTTVDGSETPRTKDMIDQFDVTLSKKN